MSAVLGSVFLLGSTFVIYEYFAQKKNMEQEYATTAKIIADRSQAAILFQDISGLEENLSSLKVNKDILLGCIYADDLSLLAHFKASGVQIDCPDKPEATIRNFTQSTYLHSEPVVVDRKQVGTLLIGVTLTPLFNQLSIYFLVVVAFGTLVSALAFVLSRYLQESFARPLLNLADTADQVSQTHDYSLSAVKESDDEIGILVDAFNDMMNKVKAQNEDILQYTVELDNKVQERTNELDQANNQLAKRNDELAIANKELEAFSYSVSHDLRSPLRAVDGFTRALEEDYYDELDDLAKSYIKRARGAAQKMGELISTLLQLSRVSRKELELVPTDISDIAQKVCSHLRDNEPDRQVDVSVQEGMKASVDIMLMEAAFDNLIGNAWKYTGKEEQALIEIGCLEDQGTQVYFVKDNGAGFDKNYAKDLFTAFKRLHGEEEFEGTGIGLATVARIIHRHHGDVWATSEVGQGAQFFFTLNEGRPDHHEADASSNSDEYKNN